MKKKELKRNLTEAKTKIDMLETQLAAEKLNSAWSQSETRQESDKLKKEIDDIKRELALKTIELNWFHEKGSEKLWSVNYFLNKMAENLEEIANKRNLEGNSIKIDIIPVPLKDGLIKGYRSIVTAIEQPLPDKP